MGYVDLHCHLLWALDDGCETPEETLDAARLLVALGFSDVAPSPHATSALPSGDVLRCEARLAEAEVLLLTQGVPLTLHANAENRLDEGFLARAGGAGRRGIGKTGRWVLVEAPFRGDFPALADFVVRLRGEGVLPLVAHPERCAVFEQPGRAEEVVRLGGALQLNLGALAGVYGARQQHLAERLLDAGLYAVAATDLHAAWGAGEWLADALDALEARVGDAVAERLLAGNPRLILSGQELA
jgi:protein-tyrosine phosphatase